jgi:hypothetical protein
MSGKSSDDASGESTAHGENDIACSFCGKDRRQVRQLIAGPHAYICDECVELCTDIIQEEYESEQVRVPEPPGNRSTMLKHSATCSLCHLPAAIGELLSVAERGFLCAACLEAVQGAAEDSER